MNHIYKVIWSRVKNSYVVVSEIAGTARKSGRVRVSKNTLAAVLAAFLLTGISVSPVSAADPALFPVCRSRLREEAAGREAIFLFSFKSLLSFSVCPRR